MSDNPDIKWALDILTPDPDLEPSLFPTYALKATAAVGGFLAACGGNYMLRRPAHTAIYLHVIGMLFGWGGASWLQQKALDHFARKDQLIKDYIIRHPEDFRAPERKKWAEVLEPWYPIR